MSKNKWSPNSTFFALFLHVSTEEIRVCHIHPESCADGTVYGSKKNKNYLTWHS